MQVTIMKRLAERYDGYKHSSTVVLEVPLSEYAILAKILHKNILFIYKLGLGKLMEEPLIKDIRTIRTILEKAEKEVRK